MKIILIRRCSRFNLGTGDGGREDLKFSTEAFISYDFSGSSPWTTKMGHILPTQLSLVEVLLIIVEFGTLFFPRDVVGPLGGVAQGLQ